MSELFFILFFIWFGASIFSVALGPFVGLNRGKLRRDLIDYWNIKLPSVTSMVCRRVLIVVCWIGFLFPVIFPIPGFFASLIFAFIF